MYFKVLYSIPFTAFYSPERIGQIFNTKFRKSYMVMVTINDLEVPSILTLDSITAWILCHCVMLSNYFFLKCANFSDSWIIFGAMSREHDKNKSNFILNVTHFFFSSLWETQKSINNINTQAIYICFMHTHEALLWCSTYVGCLLEC